MKSFGITDKGLVRTLNEDHFFRSDEAIGNLSNFYVVADGMGGHNAGDIASKHAVAYMIKYIEESEELDVGVLLTDALLYANEQVYKESLDKDIYQGMGTTLVGCTIEDNQLYVVNVGDSRIYSFKNGLKQISVDHSVVEELFRAGQITEEEKFVHPDRNIITRAVGVERTVMVDYFTEEIVDGELVMLCSDGLNKMIENSKIEDLLRMENTLDEKCANLVQGAKEFGGNDNITVVLVRCESEVHV